MTGAGPYNRRIPTQRQIPWLRIFAEGTAIVISILLAFAIDAWWQRRAELEQAHILIAGLYADFAASQDHVEKWLAGNTGVRRGTAELLRPARPFQNGDLPCRMAAMALATSGCRSILGNSA